MSNQNAFIRHSLNQIRNSIQQQKLVRINCKQGRARGGSAAASLLGQAWSAGDSAASLAAPTPPKGCSLNRSALTCGAFPVTNAIRSGNR